MRMYFSSTRLRTLVDRVHAGGMWVAGAGGALAHRTYRSMLGLNERAPIGDVCAAALGAVGFRLDASDNAVLDMESGIGQQLVHLSQRTDEQRVQAAQLDARIASILAAEQALQQRAALLEQEAAQQHEQAQRAVSAVQAQLQR